MQSKNYMTPAEQRAIIQNHNNRMQQPTKEMAWKERAMLLNFHGCTCKHYALATKQLCRDNWEEMPPCPPEFKKHCCMYSPTARCLTYDPATYQTSQDDKRVERELTRSRGGMFAEPQSDSDMIAECHSCHTIHGCAVMQKVVKYLEEPASAAGEKELRLLEDDKTPTEEVWLCKACWRHAPHASKSEVFPPDLKRKYDRYPYDHRRDFRKSPKDLDKPPNFGMSISGKRRSYVGNGGKRVYEAERLILTEAYRAPEACQEALVSNAPKEQKKYYYRALQRYRCHFCTYLYPLRCISGLVEATDRSKAYMGLIPAKEGVDTDKIYECWNCYYLRMGEKHFQEVQVVLQVEAALRVQEFLDERKEGEGEQEDGTEDEEEEEDEQPPNSPPKDRRPLRETIDLTEEYDFKSAQRDCPFNEPLHYDSDGCPACWKHSLDTPLPAPEVHAMVHPSLPPIAEEPQPPAIPTELLTPTSELAAWLDSLSVACGAPFPFDDGTHEQEEEVEVNPTDQAFELQMNNIFS